MAVWVLIDVHLIYLSDYLRSFLLDHFIQTEFDGFVAFST